MMSRTRIWTLVLFTAVGGLTEVDSARAAVVVVRAPHLRITAVGPAHRVRRGYGELHVNVDPERARVYIDGRYVGRGDTTRVLHAGGHTVRVVLGDGRVAAETVHVEAGRLTRAHLDLD
jgi:ferric-dicitrate binding protein FerR (iron transport regulator)